MSVQKSKMLPICCTWMREQAIGILGAALAAAQMYTGT